MTSITYRTTDAPRLGDWLRSTRRPRRSYLIVGIVDKGPVKLAGRVGIGGARVYKLEVERRAPDAPSADDTVLPIIWDRR